MVHQNYIKKVNLKVLFFYNKNVINWKTTQQSISVDVYGRDLNNSRFIDSSNNNQALFPNKSTRSCSIVSPLGGKSTPSFAVNIHYFISTSIIEHVDLSLIKNSWQSVVIQSHCWVQHPLVFRNQVLPTVPINTWKKTCC